MLENGFSSRISPHDAPAHPLLASVAFTPKGVEIKAERRKPSGEKPCDIEDIPSFIGVLAHIRLHSLASDRLYAERRCNNSGTAQAVR